MMFLTQRGSKTLQSPSRNSAVDVYRGIAILSIILFHIGIFPYGFLGIDLFFVLSGFLVGGLLIDAHLGGNQISFSRFVLSRGFKIWPSYYFFLAAGSAIAFTLYRNSHPDELIPLGELPRYLLFYRNYRGGTHWGFDPIWSLCVEEHFYLILPLAFVFAQKRKHKTEPILIACFVGLILAGVFGRIVSYLMHFETYAATHNCLDALAWGTLLRFAITKNQDFIPSGLSRLALLVTAIAVIGTAVFAHSTGRFPVFNAVFFHGFTAPAFAALLLGTLNLDLRKAKPIRLLSYYSYNWYLWHALFVRFLEDKIPSDPVRILCYITGTFLIAAICTILIEEPMLARRTGLLNRFVPQS
jgi:peptidoglycan/LPS O-acetylase OafA/YrhL